MECDTLYVISLIEHKSEEDYNVIIQLLKYMICIWTAYAKEMEQKQKLNQSQAADVVECYWKE